MKNEVKHLVTVADLSNDDVERVYEIADRTKTQIKQGIRSNKLNARVLGMIFEKPSMRTRWTSAARRSASAGARAPRTSRW